MRSHLTLRNFPTIAQEQSTNLRFFIQLRFSFRTTGILGISNTLFAPLNASSPFVPPVLTVFTTWKFSSSLYKSLIPSIYTACVPPHHLFLVGP